LRCEPGALRRRPKFLTRRRELCAGRRQERAGGEIFDEQPQMLGNRKALLAKFDSLT
jgi:hypothetical protein